MLLPILLLANPLRSFVTSTETRPLERTPHMAAMSRLESISPRRTLRPDHTSNDGFPVVFDKAKESVDAVHAVVNDAMVNPNNDNSQAESVPLDRPPSDPTASALDKILNPSSPNHIDWNISSHFKGWVDLPLELPSEGNSNDSPVGIGDENNNINNDDNGLIQQQLLIPSVKPTSVDPNAVKTSGNTRFCGVNYDDAVDHHCSIAPSCQEEVCPEGMNCYVLSPDVMSMWCFESNHDQTTTADDDKNESDGKVEWVDEAGNPLQPLDDNELIISSEPTELWSEMPVESSVLSPTLLPTNYPTTERTNTRLPTTKPTVAPSDNPTQAPSLNPTLAPITESPTTQQPTDSPTEDPTTNPTLTPTYSPVTALPTTKQPTKRPSQTPTKIPTSTPSFAPVTESPTTQQPTRSPSKRPTRNPTLTPTLAPVTASPTTKQPTNLPSQTPTKTPTWTPSFVPVTDSPTTQQPTRSPSKRPTTNPTLTPTLAPVTASPATKQPTKLPSQTPTKSPTLAPTLALVTGSPTTQQPTSSPSTRLTRNPTLTPNLAPVANLPSFQLPTILPTRNRTMNPKMSPTLSPVTDSHATQQPSMSPSKTSRKYPSLSPTLVPVTALPTAEQPTNVPKMEPINYLTTFPSWHPTERPSPGLTSFPSRTPANNPTLSPTPALVTGLPTTTQPSKFPSKNPTENTTLVPTEVTTPHTTSEPSKNRTLSPADTPTFSPALNLRVDPTFAPSTNLVSNPTATLAEVYTKSPAFSPVNNKTALHSPLQDSSDSPMANPTSSPTLAPLTVSPSEKLTMESPSNGPSTNPFHTLTKIPTKDPIIPPFTPNPIMSSSSIPSNDVSDIPSFKASGVQSFVNSGFPSIAISDIPSYVPSSSSTMPTEIQPFTPSPTLTLKTTILPSVSPQTSLSKMPGSSSSTSTRSPEMYLATTAPFLSTDSSHTPSAQQVIRIPTNLPSVAIPTAHPSAFKTLHPNDKFWKTPQPTPHPSLAPFEIDRLMQTDSPTGIPSLETSKSRESNVLDFPKLNYVLLTTQGDLSDEAVEVVELAVQTFLSAELASYYKQSFSELALDVSNIRTVVRDVDLKKMKLSENLIRHRKLSQVLGTEIMFTGEVGFNSDAPSDFGLTHVLLLICEEYNEYLVSNITTTGHSELGDVVLVVVESLLKYTSRPSSSPSAWEEEFVQTPDRVVESVEAAPQGARTSIIIVSICGIAALTMLLFVFGTRSRPPLDDKDHEEVVCVQKSPESSPYILPVEIDVESAQASFGKSCHNENESGFDLNDNEVSTIISSVTDWNDYPTVDSRRTNRAHQRSDTTDIFNLKAHVEVVRCSRSHEDVVTAWYTPDNRGKSLQSAAELNSIGTRTLEKNIEPIVPKTWCDASLSGKNATRFSLGATSVSTARRVGESDSDDSSIDNRLNDGRFPVRRSLDGSFPCIKHTNVARSFKTCGTKCSAEAIYDDLESSVDCSAMTSPYDWSHIGTVDDVLDVISCELKVTAGSLMQEPAPAISAARSQDSKDTASSLNRFISDLMWLEKKINDENDVTKVREAVELTLKESGIQGADSYSYQCDSFSPRSTSSNEEDATTISSKQASQQISIVCRDVYVPPGDFKIDITSTIDGPMINSVEKQFNGHLAKGDLIIAVDDSDTRALSAEEVLSMIKSRTHLETKLTVLQFGSSSSIC